ncbi:hypothetical protein HNP89_000961 [Methanococcus maripaludis]|uniref:protein adenylyltransferase n=1 Tax=Methanococcus maripaludis TaxID=39152 RepID=A0A7J9P0N3_METMI|nr:nucleotidyltransferase [Methanococcus maripaludis]MBA2853004.1 hypothetical protein [Methanococcus maripaludis]
MAIPKEQLETWSNPGSQTKFKDAHESIRKALEAYDWPKGVYYGVYLQGSYKNSTTTRNNSDVDLVVQLNSTFRKDLSRLSQAAKDRYDKDHNDATYHWEDFRTDVFSALEQKDSLKAVQGNKCIKVETPYLNADVVVCMQYRLYNSYNTQYGEDYIEGMIFNSKDGWITNYPKQHDANGTLKSDNTNGNYYSTVRIFKNMKSKLVKDGIINNKDAPSYFIECLLYNVPNTNFVSNCEKTVYNVLKYLYDQDIGEYNCQNGIRPLFGDEPDQWNIANAKKFINGTIKLWNNWGK